jgi:hypothetical protein
MSPAPRIAPEILADIEGTKLDKGVVLDRLAAAPSAEQSAVVEQIRREAAAPKAGAPCDAEAVERDLAALISTCNRALVSAWKRACPKARRRFIAHIEGKAE